MLFNLLVPEPPRLQFYYNESLMFIPPSLPVLGNVPHFSNAVTFVVSVRLFYSADK